MSHYVYSGQVSGGIVLYYDDLYVYSGGTANLTAVNDQSDMYVSNGGVANSTTVNEAGDLYVYSGGTANETGVNDEGDLYVYKGGVANSAVVNSGGSMHVYSNAAANSVVVNSGGSMYIAGRASAAAILENGGFVEVSEGAIVTFAANVLKGLNLTWSATLHSGAVANSTAVNSDGLLCVCNGGVASKTTVNSDGFMRVSTGGTANRIIVNRDGHVLVYGTANSITVNSEGTLDVCGGGEATSITVNGNGNLYVSGKGAVNSVTVNPGGSLLINSDGTANSTVVSSGGRIEIVGTANATSVCGGGVMNVDGTVNSVVVNSGGTMCVLWYGKATGRLTIASGAVVRAEEGSLIDFDVSTAAPGDAARVNDLSLISGSPEFSITVDPEQRSGVYKLADGAYDFDRTVTVNTPVGFTIGTVAVGEALIDDCYTYALTDADGQLMLTVAGGPPESTAGDLNGDGRADIVMTIDRSTHPADGSTGAWLIQADQTATWGDLSQRNPGWEIFGTGCTAAGKTTNDVYVKSADNVVGAWVTDATGAVSGWETVGQFDADTQVLGLGDFNGDGQTDLLLRNTNGAVGCYFTSGDATGWNYFQSLGDEWTVAAVGDLNGDGRSDVVLKHEAGFAGSWLTQADYTMAWADLDTLAEGFEIVGCGDFDGDGTSDVLLKNGGYYGAWIVEDGSVSSWMGLGDLGSVSVEQIGDFDADGVDDLRIRTAAGDIGSQLVKGADTLEWKYYGSVGSEWSTSLAAI